MKWFGIFKLIEEMGELAQVLGKLGAFPQGEHPDGKGLLRPRLEQEISDAYAALDYFVEANDLNFDRIERRRDVKFGKFRQWHLTGVNKP